MLRTLVGVGAAASLVQLALLLPKFAELMATGSMLDRLFAGGFIIALLSAMTASGLAILLLVRSWRIVSARALAVFLICAAVVWGMILRLGTFTVEDGFIHASIASSEAPGSRDLIDVLVLIVTMALAAAAFLRFTAVFPQELTSESFCRRGRSPGTLWLLFLRPKITWMLGLVTPVLAVGATAAYVLLVAGITGGDVEGVLAVPIVVFLVGFPVLAMIYGTFNLRAGYQAASVEGRRKVLWLVAGTSLSVALVVVPLLIVPVWISILPRASSPWSNWPMVAWSIAPGVLIASIVMAIFYSGAVDPQLVLQRTTILGILGTLWLILYATLETLLSAWVVATWSISEVIVSVMLALLAAAIASPLRKLVPRVPIDSTMPAAGGSRADA